MFSFIICKYGSVGHQQWTDVFTHTHTHRGPNTERWGVKVKVNRIDNIDQLMDGQLITSHTFYMITRMTEQMKG